jgi:hypothetical protein
VATKWKQNLIQNTAAGARMLAASVRLKGIAPKPDPTGEVKQVSENCATISNPTNIGNYTSLPLRSKNGPTN